MEREKRQKRRSFSAEYKAEAVRLVKNSGKSIGVVALELGLVESALRRWVYQDELIEAVEETERSRAASGKS
jgi:transposase